jgi:hypothetical protein
VGLGKKPVPNPGHRLHIFLVLEQSRALVRSHLSENLTPQQRYTLRINKTKKGTKLRGVAN